MKQIRGRKALITAAGSAFGRGIALALAAEGADLYLFDERPEQLAQTAHVARASSVEVFTATSDLTNPTSLTTAARSVLERWGCLHILVNNANEMHCGPTHAMKAEQWDRILSANLLACIEVIRQFLPSLALQDEAHILNVCSVLGLMTAPQMAACQASHFGLVGFTAALRAEYIRKGFGMTALCPALDASPDELGRAAIRAIRKNKAVAVVPAQARLDWQVARLSSRVLGSPSSRRAGMRMIAGRKALVTGAASGIGRSVALALAREGADLFLLDLDESKLKQTASELTSLGHEVATVVCDLSQAGQVQGAIESLRARWSRLDILINNAGVIYYGPTHRMSRDDWHRLLSVNLFAPIQLIRELLPTLLAQEEAHILNVCSMLGLAGARKVAAYQTSKFALVGLSAALRCEYAGTGLGVTALCPGFVHTSLHEQYASHRRVQIPSWSGTTPEAVAYAAISAIHKNRGLQVVTPAAHLYWGLARLFPGLVDWVNREGWRQRGMIKSI